MVRLNDLQNLNFFSTKNIQNEFQLLLTKYFIANLNQISTMSLKKRKELTFEYHTLVKKSRYNIENGTFESSLLKE